ncbi:MAG: hypothetical protein WBX81_07070 [Nitrososphaeraceae archaeon]
MHCQISASLRAKTHQYMPMRNSRTRVAVSVALAIVVIPAVI